MKYLFSLFFILVFTGPSHAWSISETGTTQLIIVTSSDWNAPTAKLQLFTLQTDGFKPEGKTLSVELGRTGLAWGKGLHPTQVEGPQKKEGDKKSPAGIFQLGKAYGKESTAPQGTLWPYEAISKNLICVDDINNKSYNQIVSDLDIPPAQKISHEKMLRSDHLYNRVLVINHNLPTPVLGAGSCIFMHVKRAALSPTVGCTAMDQIELEQIIAWLKPEASPIIIQLPLGEYKKFQAEWGLPPIN